ncbi:hypothetical protein ACN23B_29830 (plasmid) [Anabaena sp. FACHB-709]|uniref:Uncharacterized protein n=2 Tax=Nostocaceae TaxID=1162 RepID=A0A1Z4KVS2_ANAVA|nr:MULTISPECIES: hypothetical protein [Nostocaceae]BAY73044.1 hypothetical protein NIES23_58720 [Trichormus variabilis NIES-23]HBW31270.1 hypothetical protein [Nostoc sp. UBA8866]MBD2173014.1 hypothetical protein [Anabaena cylindrica FACHB-318]MBD2264753.1 hypothetical protein [Anabaena sp. FACHB-709]MBD2273898.1 hypothetical protein [Nostoc sp. PCC 7120 = FACHB-418]
MWVKAIFWFVLLVWIADILQPGYLQFYNWRNAVALVQKLQFLSPTAVSTAAPSVNISSNPVSTHYSPKVKESATSGDGLNSPDCRVAQNDFEEVLSTAKIGCWQVSPANAKRR